MRKDSNDFFNRMLDSLIKSGDIALALHFQHKLMQQKYNEELERERLVEEVTQRVLSRISTEADVTKAVMQIRELNNEINNLGK